MQHLALIMFIIIIVAITMSFSLASQHQLSCKQDYTAPALLTTQTGHFQLCLSAVRLQRLTLGLYVCVFELSDGSLTQIRLLSIQHTGKDLSHSTSAGLCCSILHVISKGLYLFWGGCNASLSSRNFTHKITVVSTDVWQKQCSAYILFSILNMIMCFYIFRCRKKP